MMAYRNMGWHDEYRQDNSAHVTVDFQNLAGEHITMHHIYLMNAGYRSRGTQGTGTGGMRRTVLRLKDLVRAGKNFFLPIYYPYILLLIRFQYMFSHSHFCQTRKTQYERVEME